MSRIIRDTRVRLEALLVKKVEILLQNAVLLFSTTVAGSKIQFSLISVYKNWDIQPQSLDFGGSTASNEVNMRPQPQLGGSTASN